MCSEVACGLSGQGCRPVAQVSPDSVRPSRVPVQPKISDFNLIKLIRIVWAFGCACEKQFSNDNVPPGPSPCRPTLCRGSTSLFGILRHPAYPSLDTTLDCAAQHKSFLPHCSASWAGHRHGERGRGRSGR